MEKILETQEGRLGKIIFSDKGKGIIEGKVEEVLKNKCKIFPEKGVLVHMTESEYANIENGNENYIRIPISEYHRLLMKD